ncbi:MAG: hypothetical protein ABMB14_03515 [Myxococcota bacterium]
MAGEDEVLDSVDELTLRVELDLVPEWSNTLERIAVHHGARVAVGVLGDALGVKVALAPERKDRFLADVERMWDLFVERRKREGRWRR